MVYSEAHHTRPMKPTLLLILAITLLTPNLSAQIYEGMQEVSVSYGIESGRQIADGFTQDEDNGGNIESSHSGNIFITYKYYSDETFAFGITAGYQNIKGSVYYDYGILADNYNLNNITLAPEITSIYRNWDFIQFYTFLGIGMSYAYLVSNDQIATGGYSRSNGYASKPHTGPRFNFQYSPYCIRFGGKIAGHIEFGIGYKGLVSGGLNYSFGETPKEHLFFNVENQP